MAKLIGTAGHVDHGKTSLIRALTGIDADRLPEEKRRGLTIDIGFAHIELPGVGQVSIVDVPGHERFLSNMLVGALGVDVALLCVAADESVKPQTVEHFLILSLLPVQRMVVALTRADLADEVTRGVATLEVTELLSGSRFSDSPIVPVSVVTGEGLETLKSDLAHSLTSESGGLDKAWYMPIDRVFSVKGHGTVVTGTSMQGRVRVDDEVQIEPGGVRARVRSIQGHDSPRQQAERGQRTALNLVGPKSEDLHRGLTVALPGTVAATTALDIAVKWVVEPAHASRIRLSIGSDEVIGRVHLSDVEPGLAQIRLERPTAAVQGQPVIVRRYSPPTVLGGGNVVATNAKRRRKSEKAPSPKGQSLADDVRGMADREHGVSTDAVCAATGQSRQALGPVFESLVVEKKLLGFADLWYTPNAFVGDATRFLTALKTLHMESPTKLSHPRELAVQRAGLAWSGKSLDRIVSRLTAMGKLRTSGTQVALAGFEVRLNASQRNLLDRLKNLLQSSGATVPGTVEASRTLGVPPQAVEGIVKVGLDAGEVLRLADQVYYTPEQLSQFEASARRAFGTASFTASEFREALGTSRKYAIPLLEHFDARGVTLRQGEKRVFAQQD